MSVRALAVVLALSLAAPASAAAWPVLFAPPSPQAGVPSDPDVLAPRLAAVDTALRVAIDAWRTDGDPSAGVPPDDVTLDALYLQRALRLLSRHAQLAAATIERLPPRLARATRDVTTAQRELRKLAAGWPPHEVRTGEPEPLGMLLEHYRAAQRRFRVGWHVLAAVNLVESAFGRLRNDSVAGAQGPMQFIPSTWRAYGLGGDIQDPHDAILGAANYLSHSGAPESYARALYAYNPSQLYVDAVRRYARLISRDRDAVYFLYSWQVFVKTRHGSRRITGPGL